MAGSDRIFHDPDTGQLYYRAPGNRYVPITPEEADIAEQGVLESFTRSAGNTLQQLPIGAAALAERVMGQPGPGGAPRTEMQDRFSELQNTQSIRSMAQPGPATAGAVLGYAPDVVLGGQGLALRGGVRAAVRSGFNVAGREAALGAVRSPDDPYTGAALGAGLGLAGGMAPALIGAAARGVRASPAVQRGLDLASAVTDRVRGRPALAGEMWRPGALPLADEAIGPAIRREVARTQRAAASGARGLSAQGIEGGGDFGEAGRRLLTGYADAATMTEKGFPLTIDQGRLLDATNTADLNAASKAFDDQKVRARTGGVIDRLMNGEPVDMGALERGQRDAINAETAAQLGMPANVRLTPTDVGKRMTEISGEIESLLDMRPYVDGEGFMVDVGRYMSREHVTDPTAERLLERFAKKFTDGVDAETGQISAKKAMDVRNQIQEQIETASRNQSTTEVTDALTWMKGALDARLKADWDAEMKADFAELGNQWNLAKALHRGTDALTALGDVQPLKLEQALKGQDWLTKTGRRSDSFMEFLRSVNAVQARQTPDSGTPRGIAAMLGEQALGTIRGMIPGGGVL